ncbi:MAG: type II secretion system F family protein [Limnobacter sp.]|nr:type II secretion system F family protein [Limnobacter sp.]
MKLRNFRVTYLFAGMLDGTAKAVLLPKGYFQHELVVVAPKARDAMLVVQEKGGTVLKVTAIQENRLTRFFTDRVSRNYKHKFLQGISFNVRSGLSPEKSLEEVVNNEVGPHRPALNKVLEALRQGFGFVESIELLGWFDESTLAVLRAGEASGRLNQALATAVSFYQRSSTLLKLMFGAFVWTLLDLFMAVSTVAGIRFGLIDELKKNPILSEDQETVDRFYRALDMAQTFNDVLLATSFIATVVVLYLVAMVMSPDPKTKHQGFSILERVPLINDVLKSGGLAATSRVMGSLLSGGVLFLDALRISKKGSASPSVQRFWQDIETNTEAGISPSQSFNHLFLESSERLLMRAHRDHKQLSEALESMADSREERATAKAKAFSVMAFLISLVYSGAAVLVSLFVVYLQNQAVLSGAG